MFRKILCPIDLTVWTQSQLAYAKSFARFQCADIHKIHINKNLVLHQQDLSIEQAYGSHYPGFNQGVPTSMIRQEVMIPDPRGTARQLHKISVQKHFDLIIMPINLKSDPGETQCETVFQETLGSSATPILALPRKISFKLPKRILCVIDVIQNPSRLSHFMPQLAAEAHAKYFVMNSFESDTEIPGANDSIIWKAEQILRYMLEEVSYALGADEITVRIGHVSNEILEHIEEKKIDLLLLGFSHSRSESTHTVLDTISHLSIPALCIPETNGFLKTIH